MAKHVAVEFDLILGNVLTPWLFAMGKALLPCTIRWDLNDSLLPTVVDDFEEAWIWAPFGFGGAGLRGVNTESAKVCCICC